MADDKSKETEVKLTPVAEQTIEDLFIALNKKAAEQAASSAKGIEVHNSAIDEKGNFAGPGQHMILAVPGEDTKLDKAECLKALQTYVQWFSGPEAKGNVTEDALIPFTRMLSDEESKEKEKSDKEDSEEKEGFEDEEPSEEDKEETASESIVGKIASSCLTLLFEASTQEEDEADAKDNGQKVAGYYVTYELVIGDIKSPKSFMDRAKAVGGWLAKKWKNLPNVGFVIRSWDGQEVKIEKGTKESGIDPSKLVSNVTKAFKAKFPDMQPLVAVIDSKSIRQHVKKRLRPKDIALLSNPKNVYSLSIRLSKKEKNAEAISPKTVASIVTKAFEGHKFLKVFSKKVSPDDVIFINNYSDNKKNKTDNQFTASESAQFSEDAYDMYDLIFEAKKQKLSEDPVLKAIEDYVNANGIDDANEAQNDRNFKNLKAETKLDDEKQLVKKIKEYFSSLAEKDTKLLKRIYLLIITYLYNVNSLFELKSKGFFEPSYDINVKQLKDKALEDTKALSPDVATEKKLRSYKSLKDSKLQQAIHGLDGFTRQLDDYSVEQLKQLKDEADLKNKSSRAAEAVKQLKDAVRKAVKDEKNGKVYKPKELAELLDISSADEIDDDKSELWTAGLNKILSNFDKIKDWQKDRSSKEDASSIHKSSQLDYYIIPLKGIKFDDKMEDTRPDKKAS